MIAPSDIELTVETDRNLVSIRFIGQITAVAMKAHLDGMEASLRGIRPGFTVFTDLSDLESMELDCVASLTQLMELLKASGVSTVVRLIPDPEKDIGFNLLSLVHYRPAIKVITCETMAEAERALSAAVPEGQGG